MIIGYMAGYETEEGWKPITFWNVRGDWYGSLKHSHLAQYPTSSPSYTVFTDPVDIRVVIDNAVGEIFENYGKPIIVEVDLEPIKQENMSEIRKKEYFYRKLKSSGEVV